MCVAAHEMKRLGLVNKPLIIALKANVQEIADTYRKAYPNANILYPGKEDFTPENRVRIFNDIKNNNWDCVILTHEQFAKIPQSAEIQRDIYSEELYDINESLKVFEDNGGEVSGWVLRGLEQRKQNLSAKLEKLAAAIEAKTDEVVDFADLGIGQIFVDESHYFKNLMFNTRHTRVAGLGTPDGSQRAANLLFAIRTIQARTGKDLGATFLSGTTISNSLTELYLLFKYLRPRALEMQDIPCFDAWAAVYAKKSSEYEFSVTNEIKLKERFRQFIKAPELAAFYSEITDYRTAEDIGIDRPRANIKLVNIDPTPDQEAFIPKLVAFVETHDATLLGRGVLTQNELQAVMLIATNYANKMSLDMRLIDPSYDDHPDNKLSVAAANIAKYYRDYNEYKGTQFVFLDLSTYKPGEWNCYCELKRKLVEDYGIPGHEIRFIQEVNTDKARKALFADMNAGRVRVLMGSTQKLGTGVNAQERCVAIHHLDIPWRPSDLEQRNGRGVRKGNWLAKKLGNMVDIFVYATNKSLDAYKFAILENKQRFISQLKRNELGKRTIDEGAIDAEGAFTFAEYTAILSGNTDLLDRARLDKRIMALESERRSFLNAQAASRSKYTALSQQRQFYEQTIERMQADWEYFERIAPLSKTGKRPNPLRLDGVASTDEKALSARLAHIAKTTNTGKSWLKIGTLGDFRIVVKSERHGEGLELITNRFEVEGLDGLKYTYNNGHLAADPKLAVTNFVKALEKIPDLIEQNRKRTAEIDRDLPVLQSVAEQSWPKTGELVSLRNELATVDRKIELSQRKSHKEEGEAIGDDEDVIPAQQRAALGDLTQVTDRINVLSALIVKSAMSKVRNT